jgi:hypothetical protein
MFKMLIRAVAISGDCQKFVTALIKLINNILLFYYKFLGMNGIACL